MNKKQYNFIKNNFIPAIKNLGYELQHENSELLKFSYNKILIFSFFIHKDFIQGICIYVDPIRDGRNWYCYVVNDPVNYVDLWGLQCKSESDRENIRDRIHQAILKNLNFVSNDKMACDVFVTKVLEDANAKPSNWPDPEWTSVLEYKEKYNDSLIDEPSNGWNIVFMYSENLTMEINGSQVETDPTPHMGLLKQNNNGSIILFHYTQGKVKIQQFSDTEDFLNRMPKEIYHYDKAKFQSQ